MRSYDNDYRAFTLVYAMRSLHDFLSRSNCGGHGTLHAFYVC